MHSRAKEKPLWQKTLLFLLAATLVLGLSPAPLLAGQAYAAEGDGPQLSAAQLGGESLGAQDDTAFDNSTTIPDGTYLNKEDYTFSFSGGSGRTTFEINKIVVADGKATGELEVSSATMTHVFYTGGSSYSGEDVNRYDPDSETLPSGCIAFESQKADIPVVLSNEQGFSCRTTAMGKNQWIGYTYTITMKPQSVDKLEITNNTGMFKADSATLETNYDNTQTLVMALSGTGYKWLYKGTYEQAVAANDEIATAINADEGSAGNVIASATNADGKLEFRIPVAAGETFIPLVAISNSYYDKFTKGQNPIERAYYPRQAEIDSTAKTLITDDYKFSQELTFTNNIEKLKVSAAQLDTTGGPNSNNYASNLVLTMESDSYSEVFIGSYDEAGKATSTVTLADGNVFTLPVKQVETFGDPTTLKSLTNGEPFFVSFKSKKNGTWYERKFKLDEAAGTLVMDPSVADYSVVDEAKANVPADLSIYTSDSVKAVDEALAAVVEKKFASQQAEVDAMAKAIGDAVAALVTPEEQEGADEVTSTIVALPENVTDDAGRAAVAEARAAYDALADNQKAHVDEAPLLKAEIAIAEDDVVKAEQEAADAKAAKTEAETQKAAAEEAKAQAEQKAAENEAAKTKAEAQKAAAEAAKKAAEDKAAAAETAKKQAEQKAATAEAAKKTAEDKAVAAETAKKAAEDKAAAAEKKAAAGMKANTMTVKTKTVNAKAKKKTTVKKAKAFTVKNAKGKVTFYKISGNAKITVSKAGKVTVKKGLKAKKTFKVKVLVCAAGNKSFAPANKTVTLKVKVK